VSRAGAGAIAGPGLRPRRLRLRWRRTLGRCAPINFDMLAALLVVPAARGRRANSFRNLMIDHIMRAPSESPSWRPPSPRDRKHGGVPSAVLGVFAAVYTERAALRALSEHGSAEPDLGWRFRVSFWYPTVPFRARPGTGRSASMLGPHSSPEVGSTG